MFRRVYAFATMDKTHRCETFGLFSAQPSEYAPATHETSCQTETRKRHCGFRASLPAYKDRFIRSLKSLSVRSFPAFCSCRAIRIASLVSFSSHFFCISLSNSFGSTTTNRRDDPPRSKIFFGISIVIVGINLGYQRLLLPATEP